MSHGAQLSLVQRSLQLRDLENGFGGVRRSIVARHTWFPQEQEPTLSHVLIAADYSTVPLSSLKQIDAEVLLKKLLLDEHEILDIKTALSKVPHKERNKLFSLVVWLQPVNAPSLIDLICFIKDIPVGVRDGIVTYAYQYLASPQARSNDIRGYITALRDKIPPDQEKFVINLAQKLKVNPVDMQIKSKVHYLDMRPKL